MNGIIHNLHFLNLTEKMKQNNKHNSSQSFNKLASIC